MKKPENFTAGATKKSLEDAIRQNFEQPREQQISVQEEKPASEPNKDGREKFIVAFPKGERSIFKAFCASNEVSMNHFALCAMDYFKDDIEAGKVVLTAHGYKRK